MEKVIDLGPVKLTIVGDDGIYTPGGQTEITAVKITLASKYMTDTTVLARYLIHELLEAFSMAFLCYGLKHDDIEILEGPLSDALLALGWEPKIPL